MCGKPGYSTENTPSKKTSLRWGDDCPNISLADANSLAAISSSSSFVAKSVVISFKGKKNRNRVSLLNYIIYKLCKSICIIDNIGFIFFLPMFILVASFPSTDKRIAAMDSISLLQIQQ